jgi:hypothetical protein
LNSQKILEKILENIGKYGKYWKILENIGKKIGKK